MASTRPSSRRSGYPRYLNSCSSQPPDAWAETYIDTTTAALDRAHQRGDDRPRSGCGAFLGRVGRDSRYRRFAAYQVRFQYPALIQAAEKATQLMLDAVTLRPGLPPLAGPSPRRRPLALGARARMAAPRYQLAPGARRPSRNPGGGRHRCSARRGSALDRLVGPDLPMSQPPRHPIIGHVSKRAAMSVAYRGVQITLVGAAWTRPSGQRLARLTAR